MPYFAERLRQAGNRARHARRERADDALVGERAARVEIHVARCGEWRDLAIVERRGAAVGHVDDHVSAATDVARLRIRHGNGKPDRNGCVDGVAAALEDLDARRAAERRVARHHRMRADHRRASRLVPPRRWKDAGPPVCRGDVASVGRERLRRADVGGAVLSAAAHGRRLRAR